MKLILTVALLKNTLTICYFLLSIQEPTMGSYTGLSLEILSWQSKA